jgi:hypothetical protein
MTSRIHYMAVALALFAATTSAQPPGMTKPRLAASDMVVSAPATPKERGELTRQFVTKWGYYVQRIYKVPVGTWAQRMVPNFVAADASNFRNALKRDTFEGAMAELSGAGHRIGDHQVIDRLARVAPGEVSAVARAVAAKFGDLNQDLVYTPLQPCRILDTRSTPEGVIPANATRSFIAINTSSYASQGGSANDCGTMGLNATAVAINLTAVFPTAAGYATAYPFGTTQPLAASVNYTAGAIVNNAIIAQIPNPLAAADFTVYSFAASHYVADIVGYFAPPKATALECTEVQGPAVTVPANMYQSVGSTFNCPAGYTATSIYFGATQKVLMADSYLSATAGTLFVWNQDVTPRTVTPVLKCCRVPGR